MIPWIGTQLWNYLGLISCTLYLFQLGRDMHQIIFFFPTIEVSGMQNDVSSAIINKSRTCGQALIGNKINGRLTDLLLFGTSC